MFGGKKAAKSPSGGGSGAKPKNNDLANMMGLGVSMDADDDDEDSLLAELAALEGRPAGGKKKAKPQQKYVSMDEIQRMAAAGMKDIDDDDNDDDDDFDESDLLAELNELASDEDDVEMHEDEGEKPQPKPSSSNNIKSILMERKEMYRQAIESAKAEGSSSKIRRFDRGLKEIDSLIKKSDKGGNVNEEEIPPPVATKTSKPINPQTQTLPGPPTNTKPIPETPIEKFTTPTPPPPLQPSAPPKPSAPTKPSAPPEPVAQSTETKEKLTMLLERQKQFKVLALKLKQQGDIEGARKNLAVSKQFDTVIAAVQEGKQVDLSNMPQLPSAAASTSQQIQPQPKPDTTPVQREVPAASAAPTPPSAPTNMIEALQQRLEKYQEATDNAKEEGNSSKSRRMGRIVKQYQDAIKAHKLNKPYEYSELPTPPGYGPIPGVTSAPQEDPDQLAANIPTSTPTVPSPQRPAAAAAASAGSSAPPVTATRNEKEYEFLVNRQKEFKMAALQAKTAGDVESARQYLRQAKGMDQMILAAQNGMRVDITTVPSLKKKGDSMKSANAIGTQGVKESVELFGSNEQQYLQIESALRKQIETAEKNSEHYKLLGNLDAAKNFEALLTSSKKDLDTLLQFKKQNGPVPKCNYLTKTFPVVRSNPHLSDSELEITIARCINVPLPSGYQAKDMYCYVTYEFPYPQERPQTGTTTTKKETINPEFNESFKVTIDRKQSSFKRFCRRQAVNVKVHHVRGFMRSDKTLGQANIKVGSFSNKCEIHECVDLVDVEKGRKAVGGKIELLLKIREPFEDKDTEVVKEKWLVLDTHLRSLDLKTPSQPTAQPKASAYESLEVLKSEKSLYERQISAYKAQGKQPPASLFDKLSAHQKKMETIQAQLKQGGKQAVVEYLNNLSRGLDVEKNEAQKAMQRNDKQAAKNCLTKRKLIEKEMGILKQRLGL